MKKLVLVVAMFMFVCGGSIFAMAQDPVKTQPATEKNRKHRGNNNFRACKGRTQS